MGLFKKRSKEKSLIGVYLATDGSLPEGYHRLLDTPEVAACINRIAAIISSATIYLMENCDNGDVRVKNALSRFVDVEPWPNMATRQVWMSWIVGELLGGGDGNAFVLPQSQGGKISALVPMPGATLISDPQHMNYKVSWHGREYGPDMVLHFRLFAEPDEPWKGRGYRVPAKAIAESLAKSAAIRANLSSPDYKPPLIISVDSDADLKGSEKRKEFRKSYLEDNEPGQPWILPEGFVKVDQLKPLTLNDLAIKDTVELDKKTIAAIFGVPLFLLGLGSFSEAEFNNFIRTVVEPICVGIEQELTLKLIRTERRYFLFNRRRLYAYDLKTLIDIDLAMSDRGYLNGDEVREDAYRDPAGLTGFEKLENYIPINLLGSQKKLLQSDDNKEEDGHDEAE